MVWKVDYLESVDSWLDDLSDAQLRSIAKEIRLIELCGNRLALPHSKALGAGLFELRDRRFGLRIYYCFFQGGVFLLHAGNKSNQKNDIKTARRMLAHMRRGS